MTGISWDKAVGNDRCASKLAHTLLKSIQNEKVLREKHPALKEAWEQYQTILKLVDKNE